MRKVGLQSMRRFLSHVALALVLAHGVGLHLLAAHAGPPVVMLRDLVRVKEVRMNQVVGYGLVVGLSGTGDGSKSTQAAQWNLLNNLGGRVTSPNDLQGSTAAQVLVTTMVPPFAKAGDKLDVTVSAIGKVKSLEGGVLISTQLLAPNGEVIAVAQGPVSTGGSSASAGGSSARTAITTSARIPQGALVERDMQSELGDATGITLVLNRSDYTLATNVAQHINSTLAPAKAVDAATVRVSVPAAFAHNRVAFLAQVEALRVPVYNSVARVVVNERTGTIVIGSGVRLLPAAVAHGGITVTIETANEVSQPNAFAEKGETAGLTNSKVAITKQAGSLVKLGPTNTLQDLVRALNAIGVTPSDLISILQALKASGSLQAELEII